MAVRRSKVPEVAAAVDVVAGEVGVGVGLPGEVDGGLCRRLPRVRSRGRWG